jgi:hypothetical protein
LVKEKMKKLRWKNYWRMHDISIIIFISSTTNFDYIVDKINIDYSHREIFMRAAKDNLNILYIETVKQGREVWFSSCVIMMKLECYGWNIAWR